MVGSFRMLLLCLWAGSAAAADFVGSQACADCHEQAMQEWRGSHHDLAMAEASTEAVLGDFADAGFSAHGVDSRFFRRGDGYFVNTDGPDGKLRDYQVKYTFGWYPLQQYLVELGNGRLQALGIAWDSRPQPQGGQRWFHLYPDEAMDHGNPLHWTGREQNWNYQCAECHSTDLHKRYDPASDGYDTRWQEIDVACEACHGPGSAHLQWAQAGAAGDDNGLVVDLGGDGAVWTTDPETGLPVRSTPPGNRHQINVCARCHARRGLIHESYQFGEPLSNTHRLSLLDDHLYFPDGQIRDEVYVYGSFIQSRMYQAGVTCSDCHRPHSLQLRAQGNALCTRCHQAGRYDAEQHHHHQPGSKAAACTACHMPQRTYMRVDQRADHSLRVPRPDLSQRLGTPNACNGCHQEHDADWAAQALRDWFPRSRHRGAHFGEVLHAAAQGDEGVGDRLAALAGDAAQPAIVRASALERLPPHASATHLITVQRLLKDGDPMVRSAALRFLEVADVATRVDAAWPLLEDEDRSVRLEAARVLASVLRQHLPERFRLALGQAVEAYITAQQATAERAESQLNIGLVVAAAGQPERAAKAYRRALAIEPGFVPGYVNLADLLRRSGREQEAGKLLRKGLEAAGPDADLNHALGLSLVRAKRLAEAEPYLREAARLAPGRARYALVHALALQGMDRKDEALAVLTRAGRVHPRDRELLLALIQAHRERGDTEQVRRLSERLTGPLPGTGAQPGAAR